MESDFPKIKLKVSNEKNLKDNINENDNQKELTSEIKNPIITNSNENDEEKEINENEEEEEEINEQKLKNSENSVNSMTKPFISLASLSRCQCCNSEFNSNENLPFLLQCSHFFCKKCLETYFIEENVGIKCPIDGVIAKNFDDLIVLKKLIIITILKIIMKIVLMKIKILILIQMKIKKVIIMKIMKIVVQFIKVKN